VIIEDTDSEDMSDEATFREALNRHADALESIAQRHRDAAAKAAAYGEIRIIQFPQRAKRRDRAGDA
jgi:hypothetical protein